VKPALHDKLEEKDVPELWRNLELKYVTCNLPKDLPTKLTILKSLILLYSKYALQIKEIKTLPYWLRQLKQRGEQQCTFLTL